MYTQDEIEPQDAEETEANADERDDESILELARERFKECEDGWSDIIQKGDEDIKFSAGEQWDAEDVQARKAEGRPTLTFNKLPGFIRQVVNDQRQNKQGAKVSPVDEHADIETAKIYQGMIRHIEYDSGADAAYDRAYDGAVRRSYGYFRLVTEFESPWSFNQVLKVKSVKNPNSCFLDPSFQEPDGSDAEYGFAFDDMPIKQFERMFPNAKPCDEQSWHGFDGDSSWYNKVQKTIRVCDYYSREWHPETVCLLSNGESIEKSQISFEDFQAMLAEGIEVVDERETMIPKVIHRQITGIEVLKETEWPGTAVPIFPVLGDELDINGKRVLESLIRHSKDAQKMYNYHKSSEAEVLTSAPKSPWLLEIGQIEGLEKFWKTANRKNHAYLPYKNVKSSNGQPLPPPQRNVSEPPIQAMSQASLMATDDIKSTLAMFDASIGNQSNETSGVAIRSRAAQAQTSNFHFADNLSRSKRHCYRQMIIIIPKLYDAPRASRILGEDGKEEIIRLNQEFERNGKLVTIDLGVGKYDVTVSEGPSFETKRQEAAAAMTELAKGGSPLMQVAPDLYFKSMDFPMADEIAERFKKSLPPNLIDDGKGQQMPPEAQQLIAQYGQTIDALTQQLNAAQQKLETKREELDSRERIAMAELQAKILIEQERLGSKEAIELLRHEVAQIGAYVGGLQPRQSEPSQPIQNPNDFQSPPPDQQGMNQQPYGEGAPSPEQSMEMP